MSGRDEFELTQDLRARAAGVRALIIDVDGVLTDGGIYVAGDDSLILRFDVKDGYGLAVARRAGILIGLISGRDGDAVRRRAAELGIDEVHLGVHDKERVLREILARRRVAAADCCYIGDDWIDLPALALVGLPVAVADAVAEVRRRAAFVTRRPGGHGAVREVIDLILDARGVRPFEDGLTTPAIVPSDEGDR